MKERPILFSGPMVLALLDGSKTQTRRILNVGQRYDKTQPRHGRWMRVGKGYFCEDESGIRYAVSDGCGGIELENPLEFCPYGQPGDRLWVRETWATSGPCYACDEGDELEECTCYNPPYYKATDPAWLRVKKWTPSIHMPRWASRITLELTGVKVERLQEISEEDSQAEGVGLVEGYTTEDEFMKGVAFKSNFKRLWNSLNEKRGSGWEINPWVWALTFKRIKP